LFAGFAVTKLLRALNVEYLVNIWVSNIKRQNSKCG